MKQVYAFLPMMFLFASQKIFNVSTDYLLGLEHKQEVDLSGLSQEEIMLC